MNDKFIEWLYKELKSRNLNQRQLAIIAGLSPGTISHVLGGSRNPGLDFCEKIAEAFDIPTVLVLEKAGIILKDDLRKDSDLLLLEHLFHSLNKQDRQLLLDFARMLKQKHVNESNKYNEPDQ